MTYLPVDRPITPLRQRMLEDMQMRGLDRIPRSIIFAMFAASPHFWVTLS